MDEWVGGWTDGRTDRWIGGWIDGFGNNMSKRGTVGDNITQKLEILTTRKHNWQAKTSRKFY